MFDEGLFRKGQKRPTWLKQSGFPFVCAGADGAAVVDLRGAADNNGGADVVELTFHDLDLGLVWFLRGPAEGRFWVDPL